MDRKEYLDTMEQQIRSRQAGRAVRREMEGHIEEQKIAFQAAGMTAEEAETAAVAEMGDPVEAGAALDLVHRPRVPWGSIVLIVFLSLLGLGVRTVITARLPGVTVTIGDPLRQLIYLCLGLALMIGVCLIDYSRIGRRARGCTLMLAVLLLLGGFVFGVTVNGMAGWVYFMGVAVSINLFWPLFAPLYGGILYQYRQEGMKGLGKCVAWMLPGLLVTALCARMGTALLLLEIDLILLGIAVGKGWFQVSKKKVLAGIGAGMAVIPAAAALFAGIFGNGYQKLRLALLFGQAEGEMSWPKEVLREVLGGSRLVGTSASLQGQIQEFPAVDYVLTYVTGYFGILAALALLGLILYLIGRLFHISLGQKNRLGMLMGAGCCVALLAQIGVYVLRNLGILFPGEVYCPFITTGGSVMLVTYLMFGLLLSICRYQDIPLEEENGRSSLTKETGFHIIKKRTDEGLSADQKKAQE